MKTFIFLLFSSTAFAQYNFNQGYRDNAPSLNQVYQQPQPVYIQQQQIYRAPAQPNYNYNYNTREPRLYEGSGYYRYGKNGY